MEKCPDTRHLTFTGNPRLIYSKDSLIQILNEHRVSWERWPADRHRSVDDLLEILNTHQAEFVTNKEDLLMQVHATVVIIQYHDGERLQELYEYEQINTDTGKTKKRGYRGVGEMVKNSEFPFDTAKRCLKEELSFEDPNLYRLGTNVISQWTTSSDCNKWPGFNARYYKRTFGCYIHTNLYHNEGYEEKSANRIITFRWKETSEFIMKWPEPFLPIPKLKICV